jgi:hypothetical protein
MAVGLMGGVNEPRPAHGGGGGEGGDGGSATGGVSAATKASSALGVVGAFALAILVNVVVARHYKRWDWTSARLYSLSEPTRQTLHTLAEPVQINVLLSSSDPLSVSVRHLLEAYGAETERLDVRYIDPDRKPAEFLAFQQKYGLLTGRTEDGRVVADAAIVVVKGARKWFLTPTDLVDVSEADEGRSRPRLEQGITMGIRNVLGGERARVCFSKGHGELSVDDAGPRGLGELRRRLDRNNIDVSSVDTAAPDARAEAWKGCSAIVVAGPQTPFGAAEASAIRAYFEGGGSVMLFLNPLLDGEKKRVVPSGLEPVMAAGGVEARGDLALEQDKAFRLPQGVGESFLAQPKPHAITEALVGDKAPTARILMVLSQSFVKLPSSPVQPAALLTTSDSAYGSTDFLSWKDDALPEKHAGDHDGPLVVAMASELPKAAGSAEPRGARMVVVGSSSVTQAQAWQEPGIRGGAYFVENAISWLTSRPQLVDIPAKPSVMAGLRLTEESLKQISTYVTLYIPLAGALVGLAVFLRRRSTEKRRDAARSPRGGAGGSSGS